MTEDEKQKMTEDQKQALEGLIKKFSEPKTLERMGEIERRIREERLEADHEVALNLRERARNAALQGKIFTGLVLGIRAAIVEGWIDEQSRTAP